MIIHWERPENVLNFEIQFTKQDAYSDVHKTNKSIEPEKPSHFRIEGLEPKTKYNFSIVLKYVNSNRTYRWTPPHKIEFETLGDRPSPPNKPTVRKSHNTIYVEWNKPRENGADITEYILESMKVSSSEHSAAKESRHKRSVEESNDINHENHNEIEQDVTEPPVVVDVEKPKVETEWKQIYKGFHAQYIYSGHDIEDQIFRVKALNEYGWSDYSASSEPVNNMILEDLSRAEAGMNRLWMLVMILTTMVLIFACLMCTIWGE
jgi:hypothetical protein